MIALAIAVAVAAPTPLAALDYWVGHCWTAQIAPDTTDRHCFASVYRGAHVRDTHEVRKDGKIVYAGETLYSVEGGRTVFTYWNSTGEVMRGEMTPGAELRFTTQATKLPGTSITVVWRKTAGGYETEAGNLIRRFHRDGR